MVRFAQTNGYERDDEKPFVWRYRDYVIAAFNEDKPYDRFVLEQLAGDEMEDVSDESIIATGYYHLGVWDDEPDDKAAAIEEGLDDVLRTTAETFLGLTIGCARCHDHKFDPIPQTDYYRMLAFVRNIAPYGKDKQHTHWELNPDAVLTPLATMAEAERWRGRQAELKAQIDQLRNGLASQSPGDKEKTEKAIAQAGEGTRLRSVRAGALGARAWSGAGADQSFDSRQPLDAGRRSEARFSRRARGDASRDPPRFFHAGRYPVEARHLVEIGGGADQRSTAGFGRMDRRSGPSADRASARQSPLAASFRSRHRVDAQ